MLKNKISSSSFFYKLYLYFRIYWLERGFIEREKYSQCGEDIFINDFFKKKEEVYMLTLVHLIQ